MNTIATGLARRLATVWSPTVFGSTALSAYAAGAVVEDTRRGLLAMNGLAVVILAAEAILFARLDLGHLYLYTNALLVLLAGHVLLASRAIDDLRTLNTLGMTVLVVSALAFVLLAHRTGGFSLALFASIALLFTMVPMMPWGLREATLVTVLIYALCTLSTGAAGGRFTDAELLTLQFVMFGAGLVSLTLVARNMSVRKRDIAARYALEEANSRIRRLSRTDPLTGAGNRRALSEAYLRRVPEWRAAGTTYRFALIDLDDFKALNDTCGHDVGDRLLRETSQSLRTTVGDRGGVYRMGGDEFAVLASIDGPDNEMEVALEAALDRMGPLVRYEAPVRPGFSVGIVDVGPGAAESESRLYKLADLALYEAKRDKGTSASPINVRRRRL